MSLTFELTNPSSRLDVIAQALGAASYVVGNFDAKAIADMAMAVEYAHRSTAALDLALIAVGRRAATLVEREFINHVRDVALTHIIDNYERKR